MPHRTPHAPEAFLLLLGLALRLAFALLPRHAFFLLLEDDAWMIAAIARHFALGHGITADGLNPTNGFHPLYPLTIGSFPYLLAPDHLDAGFRANLLLCALLGSLALLPFYGLVRAFASRPVALAGLAVLALNPFLVRVSVNAMETSLALLLLLTLWWYALVVKPQGRAGHIAMGILAGLAVLARLDALIAAGMLGLVLLGHELRQRRVPWRSLEFGGTVAAVLAPYFAWNVLQFGHLTPSSGRAIAYMHSFRESFALTSGLQLAAYQPALDLTRAPAWLLALVLVVLVALVWTLDAGRRGKLAPLLLYAPALTGYYAYVQQQGRPRYYVGVAAVGVVLVCAWASHRSLPASLPRWLARVRSHGHVGVAGVVVLLNSVLFAAYVQEVRHAPSVAQPAMYQAARWIASSLPTNTVLAAQNSGIFQYYSERAVLNIDGKLNHEMIPVLEQRGLEDYLQAKGVRYLVDLPGVADYIVFYSRTLSDAPAHRSLSLFDRFRIYTAMTAAALRLGPPVVLEERVPTRVFRPFSEVATGIKRFPLPNDPSQAVTVYRLHDSGETYSTSDEQ